MTGIQAFSAHTIVVFDGVCNLCNGLVRFIVRHDKRDVFRFVQLQSAEELLTTAGPFSGDRQTVIVLRRNIVYTESDAVLMICADLGGWWNGLRWLKIVPKPVRDGAYRLIARHRYRWFGRQDQCPAPDESLRHKFMR